MRMQLARSETEGVSPDPRRIDLHSSGVRMLAADLLAIAEEVDRHDIGVLTAALKHARAEENRARWLIAFGLERIYREKEYAPYGSVGEWALMTLGMRKQYCGRYIVAARSLRKFFGGSDPAAVEARERLAEKSPSTVYRELPRAKRAYVRKKKQHAKGKQNTSAEPKKRAADLYCELVGMFRRRGLTPSDPALVAWFVELAGFQTEDAMRLAVAQFRKAA